MATDFEIRCDNGVTLAATSFQPSSGNKASTAVFIGPATGIRRTFYKAFAAYLCQHDIGVITYDNHGIGGSMNAREGFPLPSLISWGQNDMSAVLRVLQEQFPAATYHLVGHSAGGQLLGLMENVADLRSIFNVAASSGSIRNMQYPFKIAGAFFLNWYIPINNFLFGQTNSQWVGMGEPLPKQVGADWRRWCNGSGYVATDFGTKILEHHYDAIRAPSLWLHATDDNIANLANVKDMMRVLPHSPAQIRSIDPREWGYPDVGHMKFFSSKRDKLWSIAVEWLTSHS
ncbi:MAG: alpha/beta fold hydrolase [Saprospiraceae bacterium]|nr:alpha/beta fold hydrolase [Saprospiraceae bacterium]